MCPDLVVRPKPAALSPTLLVVVLSLVCALVMASSASAACDVETRSTQTQIRR